MILYLPLPNLLANTMCYLVLKPLIFFWFSRHYHIVTLLIITKIVYCNYRWHKLYLHYLIKTADKECFCFLKCPFLGDEHEGLQLPKQSTNHMFYNGSIEVKDLSLIHI